MRAQKREVGRSGLVDIARPEGVRVMGKGGPDLGVVPNAGRSETDLVMRGREVEEEGKRGVRPSDAGTARGTHELVCASEGPDDLEGEDGDLTDRDGGGLDDGGGVALIATRSAGSVLLFALFRLSRATRSGSSDLRLKLAFDERG